MVPSRGLVCRRGRVTKRVFNGRVSWLELACSRLRDSGEKSFSKKKKVKNARGLGRVCNASEPGTG